MRYILLILFSSYVLAQAQVTNVESKRVRTDTVGWTGEANTGFKFVREAGNVFTSNTDARVQYKTKKDLYLILGEYNWSGAIGKSFTNNAYVHLRYNRALRPEWLKWEVFSQVQFNEVTRIKLRLLNGTGPRFKLLSKEKGVMYLGTLYMFEHSKELDIEDEEVVKNEHRFSSYLSYSFFPTEQVSLVSTTYYQPKFNKRSDFRVAHVSEMRVKVLKNLVLSMIYKLNFDTKPAMGIARVTHSFENKIGIVF